MRKGTTTTPIFSWLRLTTSTRAYSKPKFVSPELQKIMALEVTIKPLKKKEKPNNKN